MLNIVLFGPPGAGKGTQSERIMNAFGLVHLSTGNLLRAEIAAQTTLGLEAKSLIEAGKLVPDDIVIGMMAKHIGANSQARGFIFDGFPRTVKQAEALDKMLETHGTSITCMISMGVDREELGKRLLKRAEIEGRTDDTQEVIAARLETYERETLPVAEYYRVQNKLIAIDGIGAIEEIFGRIARALNPLVAGA
ncbi:MAG: adenylate kinase [Bacteroidetes bacterium]|jgi:adenylate kinase|nr:adenylate kinase [Bacteroidota bacterium]